MKFSDFMSNKKNFIFIASAIAILISAIGVTAAYLISITPTISNEFTPAHVTCEVEESFDGNVKTDVKIRNTGNTDAFIRATIVANWVSADDGKILSSAPIEGTDYTVEWGNGNWFKGTDGFWYYKPSVSADSVTDNLINSAQSISSPDGYILSIKILATAIQSNPETAVEDEWGVTVENSKIISR